MATTPTRSKTFSFEWDARSLLELHEGLAVSSKVFYHEVGEEVLRTIRGLIRSRTGALAKSWKQRRLGSNVQVYSGGEYVYPSVKGAFIRPTNKKALVFRSASGALVFAKRVRYPPGAYVGRARGVRSSKSYLDDAVIKFASEGVAKLDAFLTETLKKVA